MDPEQRRLDARRIFAAALQAADPRRCVRRTLSLEDGALCTPDARFPLEAGARLLLVGAGKATPAMAAEAEAILGKHLTRGAINTKYGHALPLARVRTTECAHPVPDAQGVEGAGHLLSLLDEAGEKDLVLCLFSGGGSALLPAPAQGITLAEKQQTTRLLLGCGATIDETNALRKHLSSLKGGLLARRAAPARLLALMLSDVIGDPLDTIASGPTCPDPTTFAQCLDIADSYDLRPRLPPAVRQRLEAGAQGHIEETPKEGDPCFARVHNLVVGNNALAVDAARQQAEALGYASLVLSTRLRGEAREVAAVLAATAQELCASGRPLAPPACLIWGGETTVTLRGKGRGGRNQELALAAALHLDGWPDLTLLSGGTDGTDGPTDAAGALVDGHTLERARRAGLSAAEHLARNDSYAFFQALGDLLVTGPTGTNVMDLQIVLAG